MKKVKPDILAVRTVNQYRRRDVLVYMGLRYYLENHCARRDRWATEVAPPLVESRNVPVYFHALHFKEYRNEQEIEFRDIHLPGPNEAMAEAALLNECSKHPTGFQSLSCVFSYRLANVDYKGGMFQPYFAGFKERHQAVAAACRISSAQSVLYTDIKRFYPSIPVEVARQAWVRAAEAAGLGGAFKNLGAKLLQDHSAVARQLPNCAGILTGPMFSHLVGNLVLKDIDQKMLELLPGQYFRYVDDIIIVGGSVQVEDARKRLAAMLESLGLHLHENNKDFRVSAKEWMEGEHDFAEDGRRPSWKTFVGGLKHLLLAKPELHTALKEAFDEEGMRVPVPDYSETVWETTNLRRFMRLFKYKWFRPQVQEGTIAGLVGEARLLKEEFRRQLYAQAEGVHRLQGYDRKRKIPKLRYFAGRLIYLASGPDLLEISNLIKPIHELRLLGEACGAIATRNVSNILGMGTNAVQAAAQVLRLKNEPVSFEKSSWTNAEIQGLAILKLNGVFVNTGANMRQPDGDLNRFAESAGRALELMRSEDLFIRELACLHGVSETPRHETMLDSAFDRDEQLAFDAINLLQSSSYL